MSNTNLYVPFFSQRDVNYEWHYRVEEDDGITVKGKHYKKGDNHPDDSLYKSFIADGCCNITCLAMVLNYLGVTTDNPKQMAKKIFATNTEATIQDFDRYVKYRKMGPYGPTAGSGCIENPYVLKAIANDIYKVRNTYCVENNYSLEDVKNEVKAGFPVIVNCGIVRPSINWLKDQYDNNPNITTSNKNTYEKNKDNSTWEYHGHYIVVTGFTENGDIIVNDPWGKATNDAGSLPQKLINNHPEDAWGFYSSNINNGTNKGEHIILSETDFKRQYHNKFYSVLIIYDRRWSFPFDDVMTNFVTLGNNKENSKIVPSSTDIDKCYDKSCKEVHYPITCNKQAHNGLHITNGKGSDVYSIGSGILIAAKVCMKNDENIPNGSNCFVLVKNQVRKPDTEEIKDFFVLYHHLLPIQKDELEQSEIRFIKELLYEKDYIYSSNVVSQYHNTCIEKLNALKSGQTVIFNDISGLIFEVAEHDIIGKVGSKGFSEKNVKDCIHWEIFSSENIFDKDSVYDLVDLSNTCRFDSKEVIDKLKDIMFFSFKEDDKYKKYCKYLDKKNEITRDGIEDYYNSTYRDNTLNIILKNRSEWDSTRDFSQEYKNQKGMLKIKDLDKFNKENVQPFLWWNDEINSAMNKELNIPFTSRIAYYYNPIKFLYWLMSIDDIFYKKISPTLHFNEWEELSKKPF